MLVLMQSVLADVLDYSGSLRLKYEYQHVVINDVSIFLAEDINNPESNMDKNIEFCFAEDITENIIKKKKEEFKFNILNKNLNSSIVNKKNIKKYISREKIKNYLEKKIVPLINQEQKNVIISRDEKSNKIIFDGYGQQKISVNIKETIDLIIFAIENNISYVNIDVTKIEPILTVKDDELKKIGITELVSVGRSDFSNSSWKRIKNVTNGASKFNGYIIPDNYIFSFNEQLGEINASTGFVPELVILGDKVIPEYGGGLCQVSSTAYRGSMLAGVEIVERHNHSYAVSYYAPHGSDATIYSPTKDFKFKNTSGHALLMQTRRGGHNNNELFYYYYGTKPKNRDVYILGPFKSNFRGALASKVTYDSSLPEGTHKVVSHSVSGFTSRFYRIVKEDKKDLYNDIFKSIYQARGYWEIRGGEDPSKKIEETEEIEEIEKNEIS